MTALLGDFVLGVDLDGIATCGTLQSSIQHALRRLGRTGLA